MLRNLEGIEDVIARVNNQTDTKFVLAMAGGGSEAISTWMTQPGASKSVLSIHMPYSDNAIIDYLGTRPERFCSHEAARLFAMKAFGEARALGGNMGVGTVCALATDREKKGPHRFYVAVQQADLSICREVVLEKGARSRVGEEIVVARDIVGMIAQATGIRYDLCDMPCSLSPEERQNVNVFRAHALQGWQDVMLGNKPYYAHGEFCVEPGEEWTMFPGSFNPYHEGHLKIRAVAEDVLQQFCCFELSLRNADKPPLDYLEINKRLHALPDDSVLLTNAATFVEKAELFPNVTFAVGMDTLARISNGDFYTPLYSIHPEEAWAWAVGKLQINNAKFLVFARRNEDGSILSLDNPGNRRIPDNLRALCTQVPPDTFCMDVSSSQIRDTEGFDLPNSCSRDSLLAVMAGFAQEIGQTSVDVDEVCQKGGFVKDNQFWYWVGRLRDNGYIVTSNNYEKPTALCLALEHAAGEDIR